MPKIYLAYDSTEPVILSKSPHGLLADVRLNFKPHRKASIFQYDTDTDEHKFYSEDTLRALLDAADEKNSIQQLKQTLEEEIQRLDRILADK